jgi:hypothetical protein
MLTLMFGRRVVMKAAVLAPLALTLALAPSSAQNFSAEDLARRTVERRAVEAVIWGMPAVNFDLMLQAMIGSAAGKPNLIVYWSRLTDWKNQTLTPNPDVIYLMPFFNTKDAGPMVLEIPPADEGVINGTVMDVWQVPLEDAQHDCATTIEPNDVERVLTDINADYGNRTLCRRSRGVLLGLAPLASLSLAGQEHGRTIPLPGIGIVTQSLKRRHRATSAQARFVTTLRFVGPRIRSFNTDWWFTRERAPAKTPDSHYWSEFDAPNQEG